MKYKEEKITFDDIKVKSCALIQERCTYVILNRQSLNIPDSFKQIETSTIFTAPEISVASYSSLDYQGDSDDDFFSEWPTTSDSIQSQTHAYVEEKKALNDVRGFLVIAPAGSGKSILLDRLALWLASKVDHYLIDAQGNNSQVSEPDNYFEQWLNESKGFYIPEDVVGKVPLLLRCRDLFSENEGDLSSRIGKAIFKNSLGDINDVLHCLKNKREQVVILIDGLDELPKNISVKELDEAFFKLFGLKNESSSNDAPFFFVTARNTAIDRRKLALLKSMKFLAWVMEPLNKLSQDKRDSFIRHLACAWYKCQDETKEQAEEKAELLATTVMHDWDARFKNFLRSPLELILCLTLFMNMETFPTTEFELYSKYVDARLCWRNSTVRPGDLRLLLSYCAVKTAYYSEQGSFALNVSREEFQEWLEEAYDVLSTRIQKIWKRKQNFNTPQAASAHDLDELINVCGMLSCSNGRVAFEHRQLQDFLAENALVMHACPVDFMYQSLDKLYENKRKENALTDDWAELFKFLVQDSRFTDWDLKAVWRAIAASDALNHTYGETQIFCSILTDGRIAELPQREYLVPLLNTFCSRTINITQVDTFRRLATDIRYANVVNAINELYNKSDSYEYCFAVGCLDIFSDPLRASIIYLVQDASKPRRSLGANNIGEGFYGDASFVLPDQQMIIEAVNSGKNSFLIRVLHVLEMLFFFREINANDDSLKLANKFFDGGDPEINNIVSNIIKCSLERVAAGWCSDKETAEIARILSQLFECTACRAMLSKIVSEDSDLLGNLLCHLDSWMSHNTSEGESISTDVKRVIWFLSSLCLQEDFNDISIEYYDSLRKIVRCCYLESMDRLSAFLIPNLKVLGPELVREGISLKIIDDKAIQAAREFSTHDEGLAIFFKPLFDYLGMVCEFSNCDLENCPDVGAVLAGVDQVSPIKTGSFFQPDSEELRIAGASIISAAAFGVIKSPFVVRFIGNIFNCILNREGMLDGFSTSFIVPGETLSSLCGEDISLKFTSCEWYKKQKRIKFIMKAMCANPDGSE